MNTDFTLDHCLLGSVELTKNTVPGKYKYTGYGIRFDCLSELFLTNGSYGEMSLFGELIWAHMCILTIREKISSFLVNERPTLGLDDTTIIAEAKYPNFTQSGKRFALSLHYNGSNSLSFVNGIKVY